MLADRPEAASPQINTKRSTDLDSRGGSSPKTAAPKEAPAMPAAPANAPQAPQAESAVPSAAAAVVVAAPAPAPAAEEEATPPEAVHEVTSAGAALSVSDETPASAPVAAASVSHIVLVSHGRSVLPLAGFAGHALACTGVCTTYACAPNGQKICLHAFAYVHQVSKVSICGVLSMAVLLSTTSLSCKLWHCSWLQINTHT